MWQTASSPSTRTRPRGRVVFPAAESPTTPRMTGRGCMAESSDPVASGRGDASPIPAAVAKYAALQDVLGLEAREILDGWLLAEQRALVDPVRVPQAGTLDRVSKAAPMVETRMAHEALEVVPERLPGPRGKRVGLAVAHQLCDPEQLIDPVVGEVDVVRHARGH